ncbi:MAG: glucose-6-phosphate dehydrogenase assembly protein OpcA [Bdellovibrionales bacterium]|nr:glucose-6-phosphate dehydrogenase assembly protein OpcA [Bdellovibrionales bacterium]
MSSGGTKEFQSVPSSDAGATLARAFEELSSENEDLVRVRSATNLLVYDGEHEQDIDQFVSVLSEVRPGRFFRVGVSEDFRGKLDDVKVSVRCERSDTGEVYCVEFIEMQLSPLEFKKFESILSAFRYPGVPLHAVVRLHRRHEKLTSRVIEIADRAFVSSERLSDSVLHTLIGSDLESAFGSSSRRSGEGSNTVDLNWLALSTWRQEIRNAFSTPIPCSLLGNMSLISLEVPFNEKGAPSWSTYLLCGWLMNRLGLAVTASSSHGFECHNEQTKGLVELRLMPGAEGALPTKVTFADSEASGVRVTVRTAVPSLVEGLMQFETVVERGEEAFRRSSSEKYDGDVGCLERYYKIGESTENYLSSLKEALSLRGLEAGFRGV